MPQYDTAQIFQAVLDFPETESIVPLYKDSILKIIKGEYLTNHYSLFWKGKKVIYLDSNHQSMQIDTLGMSASLNRKQDAATPPSRISSFELLFLNLSINGDSAQCHVLFKNLGIDAFYSLKEEKKKWQVKEVAWGWR